MRYGMRCALAPYPAASITPTQLRLRPRTLPPAPLLPSRSFPGCNCRAGCTRNSCPCQAAGRECDPDICGGCAATLEGTAPPDRLCHNMRLRMGQHAHVVLGTSDIPGACGGEGPDWQVDTGDRAGLGRLQRVGRGRQQAVQGLRGTSRYIRQAGGRELPCTGCDVVLSSD